ncbi:VWA domain-containing protein [Candidatus Woesearchaeota archaeon]|nr:VWA domain-containing protein [Candidatus Woesearchaeota archaeon]
MIRALPTSICYQGYCMEQAYILLLIVPIFFLLLYFLYFDLVKFRNPEEKKSFRERNKWLRFSMLITRTLILLALLLAFTYPFTTKEITTHGDPTTKVLVDNSVSMDVFSPELLENTRDKLKGKVMEISQISAGTKSELGEGILRKIEGNDNLLIISDGKNNFGKSLRDVGLYARVSDTRLFALDIDPTRNDASVEIIGPSEAIEGTPNRFVVKVNFVGSQPAFTLQIFVDDKLEFSGQSVFEKEIIKSFGEGYHKVTAQIVLEDFFTENNIFYKTVRSVPKPKVLFVTTKSSPLEDGLKRIYKLTKMPSLPSSLASYQAIVFNDLPYSSVSSRVDDLTGYLIDGNGILFIGGQNSYDRGGYEETLLEGMLPVKMGAGKIISPLKHNIVIVMDVSESFADFSYKKGGDDSALDLGKGMAVKMVEDFRDDINVGLVAFASLGQIVSDPVELKDNREMLIQKIKTLGKGEGTAIDQGLLWAEIALEKVKGTKNAILISDGKMGRIQEPHVPKIVAERMAQKGITLYTVGLPSALYGIDVNRQFMTTLATIGNGNYFEPTEFQFLNVFFGKPEAKEQIFSGSSNLAIIDREHFITQDLDLNARVTGVNFVIPKSGARSLIFTGDGNPIVVSWNFGLGRVIALATDDGASWAGQLLTSQNSQLLTRMINYAVGNPERDKDIYMVSDDGFLGEGNEILVKSSKYPVSKDLTFTKEGTDLYKAVYNAENPGYYQFFDGIIAVNPYREYYSLGTDPGLKEMVELSGGKVLGLDDDILRELASFSERKELIRKDLKLYPLAFALLIFIIEIIIRKIFEHKKYRVQLK